MLPAEQKRKGIMKIGFDAKRAFHNYRGLGNYSRDTIRLLSSFFPENEYFLFNPKSKNKINFDCASNTTEINPISFLGKAFPAFWRSRGVCREIKERDLDVYHGLSQELPCGVTHTNAKSVVTMHDAIFMRFPELYSKSYRRVFIAKNRYACRVADKIIAISEQTKADIIQYFDAPESKIEVVYQGCNNVFRENISKTTQAKIKEKYNLPDSFVLSVGAIEKRKNIEQIIKALFLSELTVPLVIVGRESAYKKDLELLIAQYKMREQVCFVHNVETADLPAVYSLGEVFLYPSIFEGFGIPILEALCVGTPVISSTGSCFSEAGGPNSIYINPNDAEELGDAMKKLISDATLRQKMRTEGKLFAEKFTDEKVAENIMKVYQSLF